ncbi:MULTISPECIES: hypothetical protein [Dactylosporangium]|uniref:Uncharacterized protein n=2 Tax=Dactylosporangium TaxID=35753 RepID=A0A9W6KN75_9ACTN|nr:MULTISPECIES: hypothetical protein [Dactylosporangium]UAB95305.1 hypothetical protein Dvina_45960 [Dactylosporangium vinaceum]UWZ43634.1 hypothetical protein Dmats_40330 [Dactylosporangium matsuzakiense]GLL04523.1 hypothetical protein GCM10017581_062700 [Dactylosporangium matsuzakiense]
MGRHGHRQRTAGCVVRDPRRPVPWWPWLLPIGGLALLPAGAAAALFGVAVVLLAVAGAVRYWPGGVRISGSAIAEWQAAEAALREVRLRWSALGAMAEPADIRPTLELTRYNIGRLIVARTSLRDRADELRATRDQLRPGDLREELGERLEAALDRLRDLDAQLAARTAALGRLAVSLDDHERRELATARARVLLAGELPGDTLLADPLEEVGERTAATLAAYRELSELRPSPSETRS